MNISYDAYKVFYYVAKYQSLSRTAKVLLASQPNLTRTIKNLESELGCTLFIRSNRGMMLTEEGERLYAHIRVAVEQIEAGEAELALSRGLQNGRVSLGASEVALHCCLLPRLKQYRAAYPGVRLYITNYSTPQAAAAVKAGTVDFAVVSTVVPEPLQSAQLRQENIMCIREIAVCGSGFSQLGGRPVSLRELQAYPLISLGSKTKTFGQYTDFFAKHGLMFAPAIEAETADQILPMVRSDLGIGFVPEAFVRDAEDVIVLDLVEELPLRQICLIQQRKHPLSIAARELKRLILDGSGKRSENIDVSKDRD